MSKTWLPKKVSELDLTFGGKIAELMPSYAEVPAEFKRASNPWAQWQSEWFFSGLKDLPVPKEGIDRDAALCHLSAIQGSFQPKHEHKGAAVAYLASLWFSKPHADKGA